MHRLSAALLAACCALAQVVVLFSFRSLCPRLVDPALCLRAAPGPDVAVPGGFVATGAGLTGYLPQAVFVLAGAVLVYAVLRTTPGGRPGIRALAVLVGVVLLAAGLSELVARALQVDPEPVEESWPHRYLQDGLIRPFPAPAVYAVWCGWAAPAALWVFLWRVRRWLPLPLPLSADTQARVAGPVSRGAGRWNAAAAGLLPALLLAVAGGPVLRHSLVRTNEGEVTFDPELWRPYHPPEAVGLFQGILHPALRLRPLPTEETDGWLITLGACLLFLLLLAALLYGVVARAGGATAFRVLLECWSWTILAAALAAAAEGLALGRAAGQDAATTWETLGEQFAGGVRFGSVWGWSVGLAVLCALRAARGAAARRESAAAEGGEAAHAGQTA